MTGSTTADRRRAIVQGAFDALLHNGLPHLSYDTIADRAGLTRQLVRYHFPDPEALMLEVCDRMADVYREALTATEGQQQRTVRLDALFDFYFDLLDGTSKPRDDQVYDAMLSLSVKSPKIRHALGDQYRLVGQVLSHEFGAQYPDLDRQSAEELSWLFVCLMYGHWRMVASLGFSASHRHVSRRAMDRLIRSYLIDKGTDLDMWRRDPV